MRLLSLVCLARCAALPDIGVTYAATGRLNVLMATESVRRLSIVRTLFLGPVCPVPLTVRGRLVLDAGHLRRDDVLHAMLIMLALYDFALRPSNSTAC